MPNAAMNVIANKINITDCHFEFIFLIQFLSCILNTSDLSFFWWFSNDYHIKNKTIIRLYTA